MAGIVVNSGIVARFKLFQRWIGTHSANRHLPYCKPLATRLRENNSHNWLDQNEKDFIDIFYNFRIVF